MHPGTSISVTLIHISKSLRNRSWLLSGFIFSSRLLISEALSSNLDTSPVRHHPPPKKATANRAHGNVRIEWRCVLIWEKYESDHPAEIEPGSLILMLEMGHYGTAGGAGAEWRWPLLTAAAFFLFFILLLQTPPAKHTLCATSTPIMAAAAAFFGGAIT